jgi:hypothetical protein
MSEKLQCDGCHKYWDVSVLQRECGALALKAEKPPVLLHFCDGACLLDWAEKTHTLTRDRRAESIALREEYLRQRVEDERLLAEAKAAQSASTFTGPDVPILGI